MEYVGEYATPSFVDIDGDGDVDAFVGTVDGEIFFFENTGTSLAPAFSLHTSTEPFGLEDVGSYSKPSFVDIDGDGDFDAFIGTAVGDVFFFENTGTSLAPAFAAPISKPFGLEDVGSYSTPSFADIDGDGDLDVFVGSDFYGVSFFENTGTSLAPAFAAPFSEPFGIRVYNRHVSYTSPSFADIDGDGDLDVFLGQGNGDFYFFENFGNSTIPNFNMNYHTFGIEVVDRSSTPSFVDIDGDGDFDAFIGDYDGITHFFENIGNSSNPAFTLNLDTEPFGLSNVGNDASLSFVDIDGDGDLDAFIIADGPPRFFENTGNSIAPAFTLSSDTAPYGIMKPNYNFSDLRNLDFVDIDSDGDFDAFSGQVGGTTLFFENTGNSTAPTFTRHTDTAPFGFGKNNVQSHTVFVDIDNDGDFDAFSGKRDGFIFYENGGSSTAPAFTEIYSNFVEEPINVFGLPNINKGYSRIAFVDIDGDGDEDAFFGIISGSTIFFKNVDGDLSDIAVEGAGMDIRVQVPPMIRILGQHLFQEVWLTKPLL